MESIARARGAFSGPEVARFGILSLIFAFPLVI
jgi:hypothetical protein